MIATSRAGLGRRYAGYGFTVNISDIRLGKDIPLKGFRDIPGTRKRRWM